VGWLQWDIIEIEGLRLVLVMTLARADFMEEIDSSYKQLGIVMSFAGPIIIVLTFASMPCTLVCWRNVSRTHVCACFRCVFWFSSFVGFG
jgi:hypothetical protein